MPCSQRASSPTRSEDGGAILARGWKGGHGNILAAVTRVAWVSRLLISLLLRPVASTTCQDGASGHHEAHAPRAAHPPRPGLVAAPRLTALRPAAFRPAVLLGRVHPCRPAHPRRSGGILRRARRPPALRPGRHAWVAHAFENRRPRSRSRRPRSDRRHVPAGHARRRAVRPRRELPPAAPPGDQPVHRRGDGGARAGGALGVRRDAPPGHTPLPPVLRRALVPPRSAHPRRQRPIARGGPSTDALRLGAVVAARRRQRGRQRGGGGGR